VKSAFIRFVQQSQKDAIVAQEDTGEVGVYIDAMRVGYLHADSAKESCNFIKTKNLSKNDAFEVESIIIGNPKGDKWYVKLNMPCKMQNAKCKSLDIRFIDLNKKFYLSVEMIS